jgi:hypothetical protein
LQTTRTRPKALSFHQIHRRRPSADATTTACNNNSTTMAENNSNAMMMKDYPMADDVDWPEAWVMTPDELLTDQSAPNRLTPNIAVSPAQMRQLGIAYWKMPDVDKYEVRIYKLFVIVLLFEDHHLWFLCISHYVVVVMDSQQQKTM